MKKLFALLLAVIMVVTMFAGCNNTPAPATDPQEDPSTGTSATDPAPTDPAEPLTNAERYPLESTKTYTVATNAADPANRELFQNWNEITGLDVDWLEMSGDTLSAAIAGGDIPDAIINSWGMDKSVINEYGQAGKFINFADYLQYMPNFAAHLEDYPSALLNYQNEDGSFYSLPTIGANYGGVNEILYVRLDMAREAGWEELPKTIDEFKQFLQDLQDTYSDVEGFTAISFLSGGEWGQIEWNGRMDTYFFPAFGNEAHITGYDLVDGKIVLGCATEQYKRYIEFLNELYYSGTCEQDIFTPEIYNTNLAKTVEDLVAVSPRTSVTADNFESGIIELAVMAPLTSEWQSEQIFNKSTAAGWQVTCVNAELPEEDIITLVQWLDAFYATAEDPLNEEGTIFGHYLFTGEEGVHYKLNGDGTYERLYQGDYQSTSEWINNEGSSWCMSIADFLYITSDNSVFTRKQEGVRDNLWPHLVELFSTSSLFLTQDEQDIANDTLTELNLYMETAFAKFITGEWTVEANWDEYIDGLDSIGAFELQEAYQAAYDRQN